MNINIKQKVFLLKNIPKKKCRYCKSKENLTYDHKIPLIKGGTNEIKNIQVLCHDCNQMKSSLTNGEVNQLFKWFKRVEENKKKFSTIKFISTKYGTVTIDDIYFEKIQNLSKNKNINDKRTKAYKNGLLPLIKKIEEKQLKDIFK